MCKSRSLLYITVSIAFPEVAGLVPATASRRRVAGLSGGLRLSVDRLSVPFLWSSSPGPRTRSRQNTGGLHLLGGEHRREPTRSLPEVGFITLPTETGRTDSTIEPNGNVLRSIPAVEKRTIRCRIDSTCIHHFRQCQSCHRTILVPTLSSSSRPCNEAIKPRRDPLQIIHGLGEQGQGFHQKDDERNHSLRPKPPPLQTRSRTEEGGGRRSSARRSGSSRGDFCLYLATIGTVTRLSAPRCSSAEETNPTGTRPF